MKLTDLGREPGEKYLGLFKGIYLGAVPLDVTDHEAISDTTVKRCFAQGKELNQLPHKVWIAVTSFKVLTLGRKAHHVLARTPIQEIVYCGLLSDDPRRFSFVACSEGASMSICHLFTIKEESAGLPICISNGFEAYLADQESQLQQQRDAKAKATQAARADREERERLMTLANTSGTPKAAGAAEPTTSAASAQQVSSQADPQRRGTAPPLASRSSSTNSLKTSVEASAPEPAGPRSQTVSDDAQRPKRKGFFRRRSKTTDQNAAGSEASKSDNEERPMGTFIAKYLGSIGVTENTGAHVVQGALARLQEEQLDKMADKKKKKVKKLKGDAVLIVITVENIKLHDRLSDTMLENHFIRDVTFTTAGVLDKRRDLFAFITTDPRINQKACHCFELIRGKGQAICRAVARAFDEYAKTYKSTDDVFAAKAPEVDLSDVPMELQLLQVDRSRLEQLKVLGAGMYGKVFLADETQEDGSVVQRAVKLLRKSSKEDQKDAFVRECQIMAELRHENLVSIVGVAVKERPWLCVLEFMQYGDLAKVLQTARQRNFKLFRNETLHLALQLSRGMAFIASKRYVHLDLAARNCLLHTNSLVKIADFGLARPLDEGKDYWVMRKSARLAVKWIPPDALMTKRFGEPTDVWAFGVLLWELYSMGAVPYSDMPVPEVPTRVGKGYRLPQPDLCPDVAYELMLECFAEKPENRPTFAQLCVRLEALLAQASQGSPPVRDIGELLNNRLSKDIRRLSVKKQRESVRRKSTSATRLRAMAEANEDSASAEPETATEAAVTNPEAADQEEDLRRRSFVADSNARLRLTSSVRRKGGRRAQTASAAAGTSRAEFLAKQSPPTEAATEDSSGNSASSSLASSTDGGDGDQPEITMEGILVAAEEPLGDDELDVEDEAEGEGEQEPADEGEDVDAGLEAETPGSDAGSTSASPEKMEDVPASSAEVAEAAPTAGPVLQLGNLAASTTTDEVEGEHTVEAAPSEDPNLTTGAVESEHSVDVPKPPAAVEAAPSEVPNSTVATSSATAEQRSVSKRLDARLRPAVQVEFTEEEKARYRRLGLLSDEADKPAEAERSRIYNALNPQRLYAEQQASSGSVWASAGGRSLAATAAASDDVAALEDQNTEPLPEDEDEDALDDEFEADDDELDIDNIPDLGDFAHVLAANREERERAAEARRDELRKVYLAQHSQELQSQEYLLVKIKTAKEMEAAEREAEKTAIQAQSMERVKDLKFDFTFSSA